MKRNRLSVFVALIAAAGLSTTVACSDDDVGQQANQNQAQDEDDAGADEDTNDADEDSDDGDDDADGDVEEDTEPEDVDDGPDVESVECAFPSTSNACQGGPFGAASYFTEFEVETDDEEGACCFDMCQDVGGSQAGFIDNQIGEEIIGPVSAIDGLEDVNHNINAAIQSGDLIYLLEAAYWDHPEWDNDLELRMYRGSSTESTMERNLDGAGSFRISSDNFDENDDPIYGFEDVEVRDGRIYAEEGFLSVEFPGLVDGVNVLLGDVRIEGDIVQDPEPDLSAGGGFAIENGKMGGVLLRDRLFLSINRLAQDCPCLDIDYEDPENPDFYEEGIFSYRENQDDWSCQVKSGKASQCQASTDPTHCQVIGNEQICAILGLYSSNYDCSVDGEVGFSLGVHFESVTTTIDGIDLE